MEALDDILGTEPEKISIRDRAKAALLEADPRGDRTKAKDILVESVMSDRALLKEIFGTLMAQWAWTQIRLAAREMRAEDPDTAYNYPQPNPDDTRGLAAMGRSFLNTHPIQNKMLGDATRVDLEVEVTLRQAMARGNQQWADVYRAYMKKLKTNDAKVRDVFSDAQALKVKNQFVKKGEDDA